MARHELEQDGGRLRMGAYPSLGEQVGALWKIMDVLLPSMPAEALDKIPRDALDVLVAVTDVKARFPKKPARKAKPAA